MSRVRGGLVVLPLLRRIAGLRRVRCRVDTLLRELRWLPVVVPVRRASRVTASVGGMMATAPAACGMGGVWRRLVERLRILWIARWTGTGTVAGLPGEGGSRRWRAVTVGCHADDFRQGSPVPDRRSRDGFQVFTSAAFLLTPTHVAAPVVDLTERRTFQHFPWRWRFGGGLGREAAKTGEETDGEGKWLFLHLEGKKAWKVGKLAVMLR